jgi:hypothetical protein
MYASVMVIDIAYLRSFYFLKAYKATFTTLLRCSGFYAIFYAWAAVVPESAVFFTNVANVCKVLWVYSYLSLMLTNFNPNGHGGMRENIDVAGKILEEAKFPVLWNRIFCLPCMMGELTYTPNTAWVDGCVFRVKLYLWGEIMTVIVTQVLEDQSLLFTPEGAPKLANRLVALTGVLLLLIGVSGFMSLRRLLLPLILPDKRHDVMARAMLCTVFFSWIGGLQHVLLSLCGFHQNTTYAVINVEMFFFQLLCHKYFVPMFSWGFNPPRFHSLEDRKQNISDYKFLVPIGDMAGTVAKKGKREEKSSSDDHDNKEPSEVHGQCGLASDVEARGSDERL